MYGGNVGLTVGTGIGATDGLGVIVTGEMIGVPVGAFVVTFVAPQFFTCTSTSKQPDLPFAHAVSVYVHAFKVCSPNSGFPDRMNRPLFP